MRLLPAWFAVALVGCQPFDRGDDVAPEPAAVEPEAMTQPTKAPSKAKTPTPTAPTASATSAMTTPAADPFEAACPAPFTTARGAFDASSFFEIDDAVDVTASLANGTLTLVFQWPDSVTTGAGGKTRHYHSRTLDLELPSTFGLNKTFSTDVSVAIGDRLCAVGQTQHDDQSGADGGPGKLTLITNSNTEVAGKLVVTDNDGDTHDLEFVAPKI